MEITKETSPARDVTHGHTTVGLDAVQLCNSTLLYRGIIIKADYDNSGIIYVGNSPNVSADPGARQGMPLKPGHAFTLPVDDGGALYVIASDVDEGVSWMGV